MSQTPAGAAAPNIDIEGLRQQARLAGVSDVDNLPFFLPAASSRAAVLLVHGFTASPWEMKLVGESLQHDGFSCLAIRLPGHGTSPEDLSRQTLESWQNEVERGVDLLRSQYVRVYAAGMSSGGLLLLQAAVAGKLQGLALLSPYLSLGHWLAPLTGVLQHVIRYQKRSLTTAANRHYYAERPLAGIHQLQRLIRQSRSNLPRIETPTLVLSAAGDKTVDPESAITLYETLGSRAKAFHGYGEDVPHVLTTNDNPHLEDTLARVSGFLTGLESGYKVHSPAC